MLKRASEAPSQTYGLAPDRPPTEIGGFDLLKYIGLARRRGPLVAAFGFLGGLLGAIYALQLTPVYTATATLLIDPNQPTCHVTGCKVTDPTSTMAPSKVSSRSSVPPVWRAVLRPS